jgi:hypothetical protein
VVFSAALDPATGVLVYYTLVGDRVIVEGYDDPREDLDSGVVWSGGDWLFTLSRSSND